MKLYIDISDRRYEVELPISGNIDKVMVDGRETPVDYRLIRDDKAASLIINGITYTAEFDPAEDTCRIQIDGRDFNVVISDDRSDAIERLIGMKQSSRDAAHEIKAPMPGLVVKLNVSEGDSVSKGQGVVVVEAMKMENEIPAPISGVVQKVLVEPGKAVDKGELLLVVKEIAAEQ